MEQSRIKKTAGFTLLEVIYYTTILSVLLTPLVSVLLASTQAVTDHDTLAKIQERNRAILFRLERDLRGAMATTINVSEAGKVLRFAMPLAFNGVAMVPGPTISYSFEIDSQEALNARDDNQNGLVDEGQLVRRNEETGETVVISRGINLQAATFQPEGTGVTMTLSNMGMLADRKTALVVSRSVTTFPRN